MSSLLYIRTFACVEFHLYAIVLLVRVDSVSSAKRYFHVAVLENVCAFTY
jgi:hypothetical protein